MKVFLGLHEISGYYSNLQKGFQLIGIDASFIQLDDHKFQYEKNKVALLERLLKRIRGIRDKYRNQNWILAKIFGLLYKLTYFILFIWAAINFDIFIFGFKSTFYNYKELPFLKFLGKKIIYVFHGSDARPPYLNGSIMADNRNRSIGDCVDLTKKQKHDIRIIEKYADAIISKIVYSHFFEKKVVSWSYTGIPVDLDKVKDRVIKDRSEENGAVKIIHSPSHPEAKGTFKIREAIQSLRNKGYNINYVELTNKPNLEVLNEIADCDFVIDQLYSPSATFAGFATEAALFAKPAVVCGYTDKKTQDKEGLPMSIACYYHPDELETTIEKLIADRNFRNRKGKEALKFVKENWPKEKVALKFKSIIENNVPEKWLIDPYEIDSLYPTCMTIDKAKTIIKKIIESYGIASFCLNDKPKLEAKVLDFTDSRSSLNSVV